MSAAAIGGARQRARARYAGIYQAAQMRPAVGSWRGKTKKTYRSRRYKKTSKGYAKNGHFSKTVWTKKSNKKSYKKFKTFRNKVQKAINDNSNKAHYIKQGTLRIDSVSGRAAIASFAIIQNNDLQEARRKTIFNQSLVQNYDKNKLRVLNDHVEIFMVNPTNVCVYVDMYEIVRKGVANTNTEETPTQWLNAYINTSFNIANNAGQPVANTIVPALGSYTIGFDVFQVPAFFQKWRIVKKTRSLLQPGECVTKTVKKVSDWIWDPNKYNTESAQTAVSGVQQQSTLNTNNKMTRHFMFRIFGQLANETAAKSTIGFTEAALNIGWTEDITVAQVNDYAPTGVARNNVWVDSQFPTIALPNIVQEYNAPIVAYAEA